MSLEASIIELAKSISALAAALPKGVAAAQPAPATAEQEASTVVDKVVARARRSKVTDADIDKAAAETAAKAEAKPEPKVEEKPAVEEKAAEPAADAAALRQLVKDLIYKIDKDESLGRPVALKVLKAVGFQRVSDTPDEKLAELKVEAEKALEAATADID